MSNAASIQLRGVRKRFGTTTILKGIDLDVASGEFCVLVGPSGCGKSTLLRLLAGLEELTEGDIAIDGQSMRDRPPAERGVAMVFQSYALYPHMTVADNMGFALRLAKMPTPEIAVRINEIARMLQLEQLLQRYPKQLSGGQRQRVAIGRAIARNPRIFLFDEPLSNLDAALRLQTRAELYKLYQKLGTTSVYVTHDQVEAMTLADRIVLMNQGKIVQQGPPLTLYRSPATRFAAAFLGSPTMNFLEVHQARVVQDRVQVAIRPQTWAVTDFEASVLEGQAPTTLGFRAEDVVWDNVDPASSLRGTVAMVEHLGSECLVRVTLAASHEVMVRASVGRPPRVGDEVAFSVHPAGCHLFDANDDALPRVGDAQRQPLDIPDESKRPTPAVASN